MDVEGSGGKNATERNKRHYAGLMDEGEIKRSETPATEMPDAGHRGAEGWV